jgi:hypothetical protein
MVDTSVYVQLYDVKTSKGAWDILAKTFTVTLHAMKLENYNSISTYICEIMSLTQQLADIGKVVDDDIGFIMLNGLKEDYKPMVRALEAGNKELSSQMVKDFLLGDEQKDEQNEKLSAMWTRNNNRRRFNKSRPVYHKEDNESQANKVDLGLYM